MARVIKSKENQIRNNKIAIISEFRYEFLVTYLANIMVNNTVILIDNKLSKNAIEKVIKKHNDKLILVKEKYIIEMAEKCINEYKCKSDKVTLKELEEFDYIKKEVNPVTKEYYNEKSFVTYENNEYVFKNIPN